MSERPKETCPNCHGSGRRREPGTFAHPKICQTCDGDGAVPKGTPKPAIERRDGDGADSLPEDETYVSDLVIWESER